MFAFSNLIQFIPWPVFLSRPSGKTRGLIGPPSLCSGSRTKSERGSSGTPGGPSGPTGTSFRREPETSGQFRIDGPPRYPLDVFDVRAKIVKIRNEGAMIMEKRNLRTLIRSLFDGAARRGRRRPSRFVRSRSVLRFLPRLSSKHKWRDLSCPCPRITSRKSG
jgi:hypothetical protein